ncbi:MAG TPA: CheR family methyltransferase [Noviherbaspirillum sp.]|uniref:CheR family methyltransferase n=1 Tax=Noviherbaspirillum sp. TaxID=1926288 RepID=UPI002B471B28|nr:CheR family methyltransferase [Noviherbaspirillum sp.]HJV87157.1 CheR family methyltransferase [Noviherbaspirillum sp.]
MNTNSLTDQEFRQFQRFIYEAAGIHLSPAKKALVAGRLAKRLAHYQVDSYGAYFRLLEHGSQPEEAQVAVDLLTTNETYFFREAKHFDLLREFARAARNHMRPVRVWSAASSTGEEAYSIAMVLADCMDGAPWEVFGSDISTRVLEKARAGHYPMERATQIPQAYLKQYCLKGIDNQKGSLLIDRTLRSRVQFAQVNLNAPLPQLGTFDVIFLRNVMIYFSSETKRQVVARILAQLRQGGLFIIGHSESLNDVTEAVESVMPSVYRKR